MSGPSSTIIVGLTGGVGAGKSTAEELCVSWGIPTTDADRWAHELLAHDTSVKRKIVEYFHRNYRVCPLLSTGEIDRSAVASKVFNDPPALAFLEELIHPLVREKAVAWVEEQRRRRSPLALLVVPLLLESGMEDMVDVVLAIAVSPEERRARLRQTRPWTDEETSARMARQLSESERRRRADYVVSNENTREEFARALRATLDHICSRSKRGER